MLTNKNMIGLKVMKVNRTQKSTLYNICGKMTNCIELRTKSLFTK